MSTEKLIHRAASLSGTNSGNTHQEIKRLASDTFAECGAPYQARLIADEIQVSLRGAYFLALHNIVEASGNEDSPRSQSLRTYVRIGMDRYCQYVL